MTSLRPYFLWFFLLSLIITFIIGLIGLFLPIGSGGFLTAFPYLIAMIVVLFRFLKKEKRAPTSSEKHKLALGFMGIFWGYSLIGFIVGLLWASRADPQVLDDAWTYLQHPRFFIYAIGLFLLLAVPLYLVTLWFYGKQARRMVNKMQEDHEIE